MNTGQRFGFGRSLETYDLGVKIINKGVDSISVSVSNPKSSIQWFLNGSEATSFNDDPYVIFTSLNPNTFYDIKVISEDVSKTLQVQTYNFVNPLSVTVTDYYKMNDLDSPYTKKLVNSLNGGNYAIRQNDSTNAESIYTSGNSVGGATYFNGISGCSFYSKTRILPIADVSYSYNFWVKVNSGDSGTNGMVCQYVPTSHPDSNRRWGLRFSGGKLNSWGQPNNNRVISNSTIHNDVWRMVSLVRDVTNNEVRVYLDGSLDKINPLIIAPLPDIETGIAGWGRLFTQVSLKGEMNELIFSNEVFSDADIAYLWNNGNGNSLI